MDSSGTFNAKEYSIAYRAANKEKLKASKAAYYAANKEKIAARQVEYVAANQDRVKSYSKAYWAANKEELKLAQASWKKENSEKIKSSGAAYYIKNRESIIAATKDYASKNPDKRRAIGRLCEQSRRARKRNSGGKLSKGLAAKLFILQKGKCPCCKQPLGDDYQLDHIMPLALGGSNSDENIQLLRAECNKQKHAKHPMDFMQSRGFLI